MTNDDREALVKLAEVIGGLKVNACGGGAAGNVPAAAATNLPAAGTRGADAAAMSALMRMVVDLTEVVSAIVSKGGLVGGVANPSPAAEERTRSLEDELDETRQRGMKGNLMLTSREMNGKKCLIKTDTQLAADKQSLTDHVVELLNNKFSARIRPDDMRALHRLPGGAIIIRLDNRMPGSAWETICSGIKSGKGRELNLFVNFQLTRRRANLLYEVRQLRKAGVIAKFYSDENGQIAVKQTETATKIKITYHSESRGSPLRTLTEVELKSKFQ